MKKIAALVLGFVAPLCVVGSEIDSVLSDADLKQPCIEAMKKVDPNLRFAGMQFLVMQSAVKLVEPNVAYAFYENSRHSRHFLMDMLSTWSEECSNPDHTLEDAASMVAFQMDATLQRAMPGYASTYSGQGN
jgi:hypothetical protein